MEIDIRTTRAVIETWADQIPNGRGRLADELCCRRRDETGCVHIHNLLAIEGMLQDKGLLGGHECVRSKTVADLLDMLGQLLAGETLEEAA